MATQKSFMWFFFIILSSRGIEPSTTKEVIRVPVGVVINLNSSVGAMAKNCMDMAFADFYAKQAHYQTRLSLLTRDSKNDVVSAALQALHLIKKENVTAIIGPQSSAEAKFVIELGRTNHVPIISFSATSPSLSPSHNPFFIRTAFNGSAQVKAIAAIVGAYSWLEVVLIYEDTEYGNSLVPYLVDAFQQVGARVPYRSVIPPHSNDREILNELHHLNSTRARIFMVHMTASLGSKFFLLASQARMMTKGYGWIVTEGLSKLLDPVGSEAMHSMEGVLGVRPYIPKSKEVEEFVFRDPSNISGVNLFGLWAYDTVWALATAVEKVSGIANYSFTTHNVSTSRTSSGMAQHLVQAILDSKFESLSGNFRLVKGELEASTFEVFNVIGEKERIIGYWNQNNGLTRKLHGAAQSDGRKPLEKPIWPGYATNTPPTKRLRIGVPLKHGFYEFLKVDKNNKISGFSADIFTAVVKKLPFPIPYEVSAFDGSYDDLLYQIYNQKYDAVVGDTTIVANRSLYVDFTLPYSESGVSMIVLTEDIERNNIWIFLKPLSLDLWLTTGVAFIVTGVVIWALEHRENTEFRGPPQQQLGMIFWFSFSTLVFAHREKVVNNWARFVLIIWVFVVLILTQSYAASLASMLTVQKLQPAFTDIKEIQRKGFKVGYQNNSFIKGFLMENLNFKESMLVPLETIQEYQDALSKGYKIPGRVAAILDEVPYLKLFLSKTSCSKYTMVGPTYKTDGFGFAFPLGSPLVSYMSRAILTVTQDKTLMDQIQSKSFDYQPACEDQRAKISSEGPSLGVSSFGGLFIIAGVASIVALLMHMYHFLCSHWPALRAICSSENTFRAKLVEMAKHFDKKDLTSHQFKRRDSRVHASDTPDDEGLAATLDANDMQNDSSGTQVTVENNLDMNENENLSSGSGHRESSMPVTDSS